MSPILRLGLEQNASGADERAMDKVGAPIPAQDELAAFLAERLGLDVAALPRPGQWGDWGNTIGALALRLSVLDMQQIDAIVQAQVSDRRLFGEIAVELGYLDKARVDRLLELQRFHRSLHVGELLLMNGKLDARRLSELVTEFLGGKTST